MKYNQLGKSALQVSEIAFGCMSLGMNHHENAVLLQRAVELGINFFDTADLYEKGENEVTLGKALREKRQSIIIATKVGNQWKEDGSGWQWNPRKAYILKAVEESLRRLQTDYIDLYQLHGGTVEDPVDEVIEAFEQLKQEGKIRYYGISSIRPNVIRTYLSKSGIVSVMMQYSLLDRRPEEEMLGLLMQHKIGVLSRGGLAKGLLVNKPSKAFLDYNEEEVRRAADIVKQLSGPHRKASATALQFVLSHPAITSAVTGIRTTEQLDDAVDAPAAAALMMDEINTLKAAIPVNHYTGHR